MVNLLKTYETRISKITLLPSDGGCFEVLVNGSVVFSKLATRRHAEPGEVQELIKNYLNGGC
jgi:selenoprotein W-related protein